MSLQHRLVPESKEFLKNKQAHKQNAQIDGGVSKGCRSQMKGFPVTKTRMFKVAK